MWASYVRSQFTHREDPLQHALLTSELSAHRHVALMRLRCPVRDFEIPHISHRINFTSTFPRNLRGRYTQCLPHLRVSFRKRIKSRFSAFLFCGCTYIHSYNWESLSVQLTGLRYSYDLLDESRTCIYENNVAENCH